jgi:hypothetical protein
VFGSFNLLPKHEIAGFTQIGNGAIELAREAEFTLGMRFRRPIAGKMLTISAIVRAGLRNHGHLMRIESQRRFAALAKVIFEIYTLPAIGAPELTHWGFRGAAWLLLGRNAATLRSFRYWRCGQRVTRPFVRREVALAYLK